MMNCLGRTRLARTFLALSGNDPFLLQSDNATTTPNLEPDEIQPPYRHVLKIYVVDHVYFGILQGMDGGIDILEAKNK